MGSSLSLSASNVYTHIVLPAYYDPQHEGNTALGIYLQGQTLRLHTQSKPFGSLALYQLINSIDMIAFLDRGHVHEYYVLRIHFVKYFSRFCCFYNSPIRVNHVTSSKRGGKQNTPCLFEVAVASVSFSDFLSHCCPDLQIWMFLPVS